MFERELGGGDGSPLSVVFELWSKSLYPNIREKLLARAQLPLDKLVTTGSYVLPLVDEARMHTHAAGQLFVAVSYRREELTYNLATNESKNDSSNFIVPFRAHNKHDEHECVTLSVGVLRAYDLEAAAGEILLKKQSSLVCIENSNLYVKFSLGFLNRPQVRERERDNVIIRFYLVWLFLKETKQTRLVSSMLTGYSPEFFTYFDIKCPLRSTYSSNARRTISLAEQLELGRCTFEVWNKFVNETDKVRGFD